MQLIQYAPTTETVFRRPLLIVPPWINKLLRAGSEAEELVRQVGRIQGLHGLHDLLGQSGRAPRGKDLRGLHAGRPAGGARCGSNKRRANAMSQRIGYCLGRARSRRRRWRTSAAQGDKRIRSATFFASLVDFAEPGDLGVFIDDAQLESLEAMMAEKGYLEGRHMATTFNMLRANDLIWSFVLNNLPARPGTAALRPALLERGLDPDAGGDARLLPAQDVPGEPARPAGGP